MVTKRELKKGWIMAEAFIDVFGWLHTRPVKQKTAIRLGEHVASFQGKDGGGTPANKNDYMEAFLQHDSDIAYFITYFIFRYLVRYRLV